MTIKESLMFLKELKQKVDNAAYEFQKPLIMVINETEDKLPQDCRSLYEFNLSIHGFKSGKHLIKDVKDTMDKQLGNRYGENEDYLVSVLHELFKGANPNVSFHYLYSKKAIQDRETAEMRHSFCLALNDLISSIENSFSLE